MIRKNNDSEIIDEIKIRQYKYGDTTLRDEELISLIIRRGDATKNVMELSSILLRRYKSLRSIYETPFETIVNENKGMTDAKASALKAAFELGKRVLTADISGMHISEPKDVVKHLSQQMHCLKQEYFKAVLLNTKNNVICVEDITVGLINSSLVHAREVFRSAILKNANSVILAHNHPSGDSSPSGSDCEATKGLSEAGKILGIKVFDHIIIASDNYYSFLENGKLD